MNPLHPNGRLRALVRLLPCFVATMAGAADLDPDRLAGFKARSIGPAGMSGRITSIEAVNANPEVVYVGAATGGLWRSRNGALTWEPLFDEQPVHSIGAIGVFQPNPDILWVGTGEGNTRNSMSVGNGVYRSVDAGKTWKHVGLDKSEHIYRLLLHPSNAEVAYACALGQAWGENAERGVFKTTDAGKTWTKALFVNEKTGCGELAMDPSNPEKLFAGMWEFRRWPWHFKSGGAGSGLFVTNDGGTSWRKAQEEDGLPKGDLGRMGIAVSRSNPDTVYALVEAAKSALLRSDDGGRTWKTVNDKPGVAPRPFYFQDLRVDPQWPNRVYSVDYVVRVSDDGGKTFAPLPGAAWNQIHGDHHALWIDPHDPDHMYFGDDGGVAESRDHGKTSRFVGNLPLAQFYHVAVDDERPYNIYGGLQDNGSWRGPSSVWQDGGIRNHVWETVGGGDGFETIPDPKDSTQGYSLWQGGNLMRWNARTGETKSAKPAPPSGTHLRFNWNAGLAVDPFDTGTVYLGSQFLHKSQDRGETWTTISPDLTTNNPEWQKQDQSGGLTIDASGAENFTTLIAIAPSPAEKGVLWVGSDDGRVHVTRDGGKTWTSVEKNVKGVPEGTWVPHIEPSRFDAGTAFVVFDNHRRTDWTPYVFRTDDFGKTWRSLASPGLRGYALVLRQDVKEKDLLFLGTEFGLYLSRDGGRRWTHLAKTIPTASVMDLVLHPRDQDLVIATHGRALYVLDDIRPLRAVTDEILARPLHLFEVADALQYWRKPEAGGFGFGAGEFRGQNRPYGAILTYSLNLPGLALADEEKERARKEKERQEKRAQAGAAPAGDTKAESKDEAPEPKVEIVVTDPQGKAMRSFKGPANLGVNRAVWDLRRDAFKQLPRGGDSPFGDEEPGGPEVPPGTYTVTVKYGGQEARQAVTVLADPRTKNSVEDWKKRWEAVLAAGGLGDAVTDAVWRIRRTRDDVGLVQQRARERAEAAGEKNPKALQDLPLVKLGETLKEGLTALEKRLWSPLEVSGIRPDTDVLSQVVYAFGHLTSSWDPPTPTHVEHLRQAEVKVRDFLTELNGFFDKDVAAFRKEVAEAGIGLLPTQPALVLVQGGTSARR